MHQQCCWFTSSRRSSLQQQKADIVKNKDPLKSVHDLCKCFESPSTALSNTSSFRRTPRKPSECQIRGISVYESMERLPNKLMINFPPPSRSSRHGGLACTQHEHQSVPDPCDSSAPALFSILRMELKLFLTWQVCGWSVVLVTDAVYSLVNWILQEPLFTQKPIMNSLPVQLLSNRSIHPLIQMTWKRGCRRVQKQQTITSRRFKQIINISYKIKRRNSEESMNISVWSESRVSTEHLDDNLVSSAGRTNTGTYTSIHVCSPPCSNHPLDPMETPAQLSLHTDAALLHSSENEWRVSDKPTKC